MEQTISSFLDQKFHLIQSFSRLDSLHDEEHEMALFILHLLYTDPLPEKDFISLASHIDVELVKDFVEQKVLEITAMEMNRDLKDLLIKGLQNIISPPLIEPILFQKHDEEIL